VGIRTPIEEAELSSFRDWKIQGQENLKMGNIITFPKDKLSEKMVEESLFPRKREY